MKVLFSFLNQYYLASEFSWSLGRRGFYARSLRSAALLLLAGCGRALPSVPGFEAAAWRADRFACRGQRAALLPPLLAARAQLYQARANDVTALLGPPDEEELFAQTEKTYHYYLRPGPQCDPRRPHAPGPRLSIRFGPLGTVIEVQADPLPTGKVTPAAFHRVPRR